MIIVNLENTPGRWAVVPEDEHIVIHRNDGQTPFYAHFQAQKLLRGNVVDESVRSFGVYEITRAKAAS